jgi:predicted cobalt transporter CbtA
MAFNKCLDEEATAMLAASQAHAIACGNGHSLNGPIVHKSLAFDVHFDEDWETGDGWNRRAPARLSA